MHVDGWVSVFRTIPNLRIYRLTSDKMSKISLKILYQAVYDTCSFFDLFSVYLRAFTK